MPGLAARSKLARARSVRHDPAVMSARWIPWFAIAALSVSGAPTPTPPPASDDLYSVGQQLFDQYAPPGIKEQYSFPSKDDWDQFAARLQRALENN